MNCNEYLSLLETATADEIAMPEARAHTTWCHDCSRLTRIVLEREHRVRMAYDALDSYLPAGHVSAHALATARRHRIVRNVQAAFTTLIVAMMLIVVSRLLVFRGAAAPRRAASGATFRLQCLSPEQAAEVIRPVLGNTGSVVIPPGPLAVIRVGAAPDQMARVRALLDRLDSPAAAKCAAQVTVPKG
jgi:hypothetical protein